MSDQPSADAVPTESEQNAVTITYKFNCGCLTNGWSMLTFCGGDRCNWQERLLHASVAKAGEAHGAAAIPTSSDAEIITLRQQLSAHEAEIARLTQQVDQLKGVALAALEAKAAFIRRLADGFTHDSEKTK
jgi:hypothetical protein